jgi:hypothetical protein
MDDKIVLICATGRSGSTTMQRIINTIPNSNICGENYGAINSLLEFYRRIKTTTIEYVPGHLRPASFNDIVSKNVKPAWYNSYNFNQIVQLIKMTIINMFKNNGATNLWGFKEIRYDSGNINYIEDFKELFPQTKVILNIRGDIRKQSQSSWFKEDPNSLQKLIKQSQDIIDFYNANRDFCFLNTLEKMYNKTHMMLLFKFIECDSHFDEDKIKKILMHTKES